MAANQGAVVVPLDAQRRATKFQPFSLAAPHMTAFHLAWLSLYACYFSVFAIPSLIPIIRDDLNLTDLDIRNAGIASLYGALISSFAMGLACDLLGPCRASPILSVFTCLITVPKIIACSSPSDFLLLRFLNGFSLGNVVANLFWMCCIFGARVVGRVNGFAAGWAAAGMGAVQFVVPLMFSGVTAIGVPYFVAWRVVVMITAIFQVITSLAVKAFGHDLPDGDYKPMDTNLFNVLFRGLNNRRGWILGLAYGSSFGMELVVNTIIPDYFYERFELSKEMAKLVITCFSLANVMSRPLGGMLSDALGYKLGLRGRLHGLSVVQALSCVICILLGKITSKYASIVVSACLFLSTQVAAGLTLPVIPFVCGRSLGVTSGVIMAGGFFGAILAQLLFF